MQTLNVAAGRTNEEYKENEEKRRADLRADIRNDANFFFWAAGLAALGTGLLPIRLNIFVSIGSIDLLGSYVRSLGPLYSMTLQLAALTWVVTLIALGFLGRACKRWAFIAGIVLYAADMIPLLITFSIWAFAVHAAFVFMWFQGQQTLKEMDAVPALPS